MYTQLESVSILFFSLFFLIYNPFSGLQPAACALNNQMSLCELSFPCRSTVTARRHQARLVMQSCSVSIQINRDTHIYTQTVTGLVWAEPMHISVHLPLCKHTPFPFQQYGFKYNNHSYTEVIWLKLLHLFRAVLSSVIKCHVAW